MGDEHIYDICDILRYLLNKALVLETSALLSIVRWQEEKRERTRDF